MQLFEVKNNIAKITYNPAENHLLLSDFLLVEDTNQRLIAQIIDVETTDNASENLAVIRFTIAIDKEDNLSYYNGYIPAKNSKIIYINPDEIIELLQGNDKNIYWGNLSTHTNCFVKTPISFLNERINICSDRSDKTTILIQNILTELQNKEQKAVLIDFDGRYSNLLNALHIRLSESFKLPLNIDAFNTILEKDIVDCPIEDVALIQSIVLELREYMQTLQDKYLPFTTFKKVVEDELLSNPISGLMLFRNKLWLYAQEQIFAEKKSHFDYLDALLEKTNTIVIDASNIDEKWHKFAIQTIQNLINKPCYLVLSLNDIQLDKKTAVSLYNKKNIIPIVSTSYSGTNNQILNSICKNQVLFKPLKYQTNDEVYSNILNKINTNEFVLYGETTLQLPLIVELQSFTPQTQENVIENEIKKDVDKLLSSSQTVIPQDASLPQDNSYNIIEDDDLLDSDLDFLDEQLNKEETVETTQYETFSPIETEEKQLEEEIAILQEENVEEIQVKENDNELEQEKEIESFELPEINIEEKEEENDDNEEEPEQEFEEKLDEISSATDNAEEQTEEGTITYETIEEQTETIEKDESQIKIESEEEEPEEENDDNEEEELEPPTVKENINTNKTPEIPVYETDSSASLLPDNLPYEIGDVVFHPKHGKGVIEGFANYSNKILFCQIKFENVGRRFLDPRIASLEKITE